MFNLDAVLSKTEEFLRRNIKSKAVKEAEKRRLQRQTDEAVRRVKRAAAVAGTSGAGVAAYAVMITPIGMSSLAVLGGTALVAATATLFWPSWHRSRERRKLSSAELNALVLDAEEWLLAQRPQLPLRALPSLDGILVGLNDLRPHLPGINPNGTLAWEVRRLIADHLPGLVEAWSGLPSIVRENSESCERLTSGFATVSEELTRMCLEASRERQLSFEARGLFIETRYGDGEVIENRKA